MAPPTLTDLTFQYRDDGVLLNGPNASFPFVDVLSVKGLDSATPRISQKDTEGRDGSTIEAEFESYRVVTISGTLFASDATLLEPLIDSLKDNFAVSRTAQPFYFKPPGVAQRVLNAKCVSGFKTDWDSARRSATSDFSVVLQAGDPIIYGTTLYSIGTTLATATPSGFSFPFSFPFTFGGTAYSSGTAVAFNNGNRPGPWRLTITGGITNPSATNDNDGGKVVKAAIVASATDVLVFDSATRSLLLNGIDKSGSLTYEGWFALQKGINLVRFQADAGSGIGTFEFYDAWR